LGGLSVLYFPKCRAQHFFRLLSEPLDGAAPPIYPRADSSLQWPELSSDHLRAQAILAKFNATPADADDERRLLLTQLLGRIGEGTVLKPTLRCDYGYNIFIGNRTFVNYDCLLLDCNRITIGDEVQIAPGGSPLHGDAPH
jgi:acetyltransferase-like isoleucine patch superfamily enzyme